MVLWFLVPAAAAAGLAVYYVRNKNKIYQDVSLAAGKRTIRVLKIQPAEFDDHVRCQLQEVSLDNAETTKWAALSYAWGEKFPTTTSSLNDKPVQFQRSLINIIRHLRHSTEERTFWIDAICINQDDDDEKDDQMRLMREIYEKAEMTYVYLGDESETSREIFCYLEKNRKTILNGLDGDRITFNYLENRSIWPGMLRDIFPRRYWARLWVVQEIIVSKNLIVKCGSQEIPWDVFIAAWKIALRIAVQNTVTPAPAFVPLMEHLPNHWKADPNIDAPEVLEAMRQEHALGAKPDMNFWLQTFKHKLCKDPRDKIFGLRGLAADRSCSELSSLTNKESAKSLFTAVTKYHMSKTGDLDVMLHRAKSSRMSGLPSWVPDYGQVGHLWQLTNDNFRHDEHYNAHGGLLQAPDFIFDHSISLSGIYIDKITDVDLFDSDQRGLFHPPAKYNNTDGYPLSLNDYRTAFTRTILFDRDRQGRRFGKQQYLVALNFPRVFNPWERDRLREYSFIYTECGYIGLARDDTKPGDMVCILWGCSVPVVLRSVGNEKFEIVCGCYVQGIMHGEAMNGSGIRNWEIV